MMYKHQIDELIARQKKMLRSYRSKPWSESHKEAAEHCERSIESLMRIRKNAPRARFVPREEMEHKATLEEILRDYKEY